jgi:poly-gamma-glutamate capsule biosynthesis protein CapA/YwtB (metallophosphatase superfamily)
MEKMKTNTAIVLALGISTLLFAGFLYSQGFLSANRNQGKLLLENNSVNVSEPVTEQEEPSEVLIIATGDISFSREVGRRVRAQNDINYPFLNVADYLRKGDIVIGNLESTITEGREIMDGEMVFRSDPGTEIALRNAGFNLITLANNHTPDFGEKGLKDTMFYLEQAGLDHIGAGMNLEEASRPKYITKNGITFAFLNFNDSDVVPGYYGAGENSSGTALMDIDLMTFRVAEAKENSDFVILIMHSGTEYVPNPNQRQIDFARAGIDAGVEMVIGHHPHVVQSAEIYKGKYIFYSLGNFVFDQMWSQDTREGIILSVSFNRDGVKDLEFIPYEIRNFSQPNTVDGEQAQRIINRLQLD